MDWVRVYENTGNILGCIDPNAQNYDPLANIDNGTCLYNVTFELNTNCYNFSTPPSSINITGPSINWACGSYALSDNNNDGIWTGTFLLDTGLFTYIYCGDNWNITEGPDLVNEMQNGGTCAPNTDLYNYANRQILILGDTSIYNSWGQCADCIGGCTDPSASNFNQSADYDDGSCIYTSDYNVTFQLDLNNVNFSFNNPEVNGTFNNWCGSCWQMSDVNNDNIWEYTVSLPVGSYEYKFSADNWLHSEDLLNAGSCVVTAWGYTNRVLNISSDTILSIVCWESCSTCPSSTSGCTDPAATNYDPNATVDDGSCTYCAQAVVNFSVDAGASVSASYDNVVINGNFANWNGWGVTLTDADGDGVYEGSLVVDAGTYEYVHALTGSGDGWSGWGVVGYADSTCAVPGTNNFGFTVSCGDTLNLATVCFGSCSACVVSIPGCTDPAATNYDPLATTDDGSCLYPSTCNATPVTGVFVDQIIHNRATFNWDNMNSSTCAVDQMVIRYREVGTSSWTNKFLGNPVGSTTYYGTSKRVINLTPSTQYEYQFKIWYVGVSSPVNWGANPSGTFTTLDECPNVGNFAVSTPLTTRATFTWDDSNGAYSFVRIKLRVDSISNPSASDWQNAGGFGINYGTWTRNKNGLTPGETYRGQSKTWCDPAGGPYKASSWTPLVFWTQPTSIRLDGESVIANLDVYPNPSRDIFNVSFTSEEAQDITIKVINVLGEEIMRDDRQQFEGNYNKTIDLTNYKKGIYLLKVKTLSNTSQFKIILI